MCLPGEVGMSYGRTSHSYAGRCGPVDAYECTPPMTARQCPALCLPQIFGWISLGKRVLQGSIEGLLGVSEG